VLRKAFRFRFRPATARYDPRRRELSREANSPVQRIGSWFGFTLTIPFVWVVELFFSIQFIQRQLGFTLAAISELTREVLLLKSTQVMPAQFYLCCHP
jgi:hypothetical protein